MPRKDCKYMWTNRELEEAIKISQQRIAQKRGFHIDLSDLAYQLGRDIREGRVVINPMIIRFKNQNRLKIGNESVKIKKIRQ